MQLSIIVAMNKNQVIGKDGALPWHISSDLKNFKKITMGKPILMGRKTHESIGKPLPGRENIILTENKDYFSEGCVVKNTLDEALLYCEKVPEVMVMGGATLYEQTLNKAEKLYITEVVTSVDGDIFFPEYDRSQWLEISRDSFKADENNEYDYSFTVLERK
jgi:dihydrofolate reductase